MRTSTVRVCALPTGSKVAFLQHTQDLGLGGRRHVAHLVEEQRAAVGLVEAADAIGHGPGEGSLDMAEQFAFQQGFRNGGAIDGDERLVPARAVVVNGAGDHFLAGAAFAGDQHIGAAFADLGDAFDDFAECRAGADQIVEAVTADQFFAQPLISARASEA